MLFRIFYGDTYRDIEATDHMLVTVGSGTGDTVSIPSPNLESAHVTLSGAGSRWTLISKKPVKYQREIVSYTQLETGTVIGVSSLDHISIFILPDYPNEIIRVPFGGVYEILLGREEGNHIRIDSPFVSRKHLRIIQQGDSYQLIDLDSTNGTYVNKNRIHNHTLLPGDEIVAGDLRMAFNNDALEISYDDNKVHVSELVATKLSGGISKNTDGSPKEEFIYYKRSPRLRKELPAKTIELEGPPAKGNKPEINWLSTLVPALTTVGISVMITLISKNPMMMMYTLPMTFIGVILSLVNYRKGTKKYIKLTEQREQKYAIYLQNAEMDIQACQADQKSALNQIDPSVTDCVKIALVRDGRLWQRRPDDEDFASVRLGTGPAPSSVEIRIPKVNLSLEEDELRQRPQELYDRYHMVNGIPVICKLMQAQVCGIVGTHGNALKLLSNMLVGLMSQHSYTELKIVLIHDGGTEKNGLSNVPGTDSLFLSWVGRLPHIYDEDRKGRFIASTKKETVELTKQFSEVLKARKMERSTDDSYGRKQILLPFYLFVFLEPSYLDKSNPINEYLFRTNDLSVGTIMVVDNVAQLPPECGEILEIEQGKGQRYNKNNTSNRQTFILDPCTDNEYTVFADALEYVKCEEPGQKNALPKNYTFYEMLGISVAREWDLDTHWSSSDTTRSLSAPIGILGDGDIISLDLHENGHGPHGLVAGTTGSGKSEVLQSFILSLALHYHPHDLGFVIIDFKGGGMASQFTGLPHLIGAITNIEGREINRSLLSIQAELLKRQREFEHCGVNNISRYQEKYHAGEVKLPLPHLVIIVDEFAELKAQQPEFMDQLISAARIGRSLGVHLVLATQKPSGQVNEQIWSNSRFRLCLKVATAEDSNEVLKVPLAFFIREPGRAYLQVGSNEVFELFQSGYSGGRIDGDKTQLDVLVSHIKSYCEDKRIPKLTPICLPALPDCLPYPNDLLSGTKAKSQLGFCEMCLGMFDDPANQKQGIATINLSRSNTIIVGASQTGKTYLLQSMVYQLAQRYTPEDINIYLVDLGSRAMGVFAPLRVVGGFVTDTDQEKMKNLWKMLSEEIDSRKRLFARDGFDSFLTYREAGEHGLAQIIVFIDGFSVFREVFGDDLDDAFMRFLREGLTYGISFILTSSQTANLSHRYMSSIATRVAFSCNDSGDYRLVFDRCRMEPKNIPGRMLWSYDKSIYEVQSYLVFGGHQGAARSKAIQSYVAGRNEDYGNSRAKRIPVVPERVTSAYFTENHPEIHPEVEIPIAVDYSNVSCRTVNCYDQFLLALTGKNTVAKDGFVKALIENLKDNYYKRPVKLFIVDSFERKFEAYKELPFVEKYSTSSSYLCEMLTEIKYEAESRMELMEDGGSLEHTPLLVAIVGSKQALDVLADDNGAQDAFNDIYKKYTAMKILFLITEINDASIGALSPTLCRKIRDDKKLLYFGPIKEIKILDVYGSSVRSLGEPVSPDDAYLFRGEDVSRVKSLQE